MDDDYDKLFYDGIFFFGNDAPCVCGNYLCDNSWNKELLELTHAPEEHELEMHVALKSLDCAKVSQLLRSGMKFCCEGEDNCFSIIARFGWASTFLESALSLYPSAINSRGPNGETFLMMCHSAEKFEILLSHGANVQEVNSDGDNVLLHNVKYRLQNQVEPIVELCIKTFRRDIYYKTTDFDRNSLSAKVTKVIRLFDVIVNSGVNLNVVDMEGRTALQVLLQMFQPGYVFHQYHYVRPNNENLHHNGELCRLDNKLASHILTLLLEAGAEIPSPDQHGRTALMLAVQSPWNFNIMKTLIQRGVDVLAEDKAGQNAIHYLLASFAQHSIIAYQLCSEHFNLVEEKVCYLLDFGCNMQGMELTMFHQCRDHTYPLYVVHYLMAQRSSLLKERNGSLKIKCQNDPSNLSFLSVYLESLQIQEVEFNGTFPTGNFSLEDVTFLKQEIAAGMDVNSGASGHAYSPLSGTQKAWHKRLCLPYPLLYCLDAKLDLFMFNDEEDLPLEAAQEQYQAVEGILRLLLPFWPHPPLALMLFEHHAFAIPNNEAAILLRERLIQFLYEVGGPLSPGSEVYHAVKKNLQSSVHIAPAYEEQAEIQTKVPSLRQLSRTALRGSLKDADTVGLDVASLRSLCEGHMLPLPEDIKDYINFRDSSVSVIKVVPEMITETL
ncbi:hypothetical protein B566_EDAN018044 [Ephemera danica]|nr:hypothetical protein B566_EDAN018044 [Ephemera danica]